MLRQGARNLRIVTTKLSEPAIDETPSNKVPSTQKSAFRPGVQTTACAPQDISLRGAYWNQPPSGGCPNRKLDWRKVPPNRTSQYPNAFRRGKAISRAPIINGTT